MPLVHHELCFGCGRSNLFGLLLEAERQGDLLVGRCFIKQDHQGADVGRAHAGVVTAALTDAIELLAGPQARIASFEVAIQGPAPVGGFLEVTARRHRGGWVAEARADGVPVARARGRTGP